MNIKESFDFLVRDKYWHYAFNTNGEIAFYTLLHRFFRKGVKRPIIESTVMPDFKVSKPGDKFSKSIKNISEITDENLIKKLNIIIKDSFMEGKK